MSDTAFRFNCDLQGCLDLQASPDVVARYLANHSDWFNRRAEPMQVEPSGENSYCLLIGKFNFWGYRVEPKIRLTLLSPSDRQYQIFSSPLPLPDPSYEVDFCSTMILASPEPEINPGYISEEPVRTSIRWHLFLSVSVCLPSFIHALPRSWVQTTGQQILNQTVQRISHSLSDRVCADFHRATAIIWVED